MKKVLNEWREFLLQESGFSRVYGHIMEYDSAMISAFRGEYTKKENYARSRILKAKMLDQGFGVTKVKGSYIENYGAGCPSGLPTDDPEAREVQELSLFVSNRHNDSGFRDDIISLSEEYGQDSVLFIPQGGKNAYLYGTSENNDYPPFGQTIGVGDLKMGEEGEFMSRVRGRPFVFKEPAGPIETYEGLSRNSKWALKKLIG